LKRIPGFGKSGTSRIRVARSFVCTATAHRLPRNFAVTGTGDSRGTF
jgi:hypothetical protein